MSYYPPIPEGAVFALDVIRQNLQEDPGYLVEAPYDAEELELLENIFGAAPEISAAGEEQVDVEALDKWARLEHESDQLFRDLTDSRGSLADRDNAEKMAYFRTATSLLDKIVSIQERTANLRQINQFYSAVLGAMEDVLEPAQRTEFSDRIRALTEGSK